MLWLHGTTQRRAESIRQFGPDASFREPNGTTADGFSTCKAEGPFDVGSPEAYARKKAALFPGEGAPVDLAHSIVGGVGELIANKAFDSGAEIRFEPGGGLEELIAVWPDLVKTLDYV